MKSCIVIGADSQVAHYLIEYLLSQNISVIGTARNTQAIDQNVIKEFLDINDRGNTLKLIEKYKPDYLVNCAALIFPSESWARPVDYLEANSFSVIHQLDGIRLYSPTTRYFNCGSAEQLILDNPYGLSKRISANIIELYRQKYGIFAVQGICYNVVSPRSHKSFILQKLVSGLKRIKEDITTDTPFEKIKTGNLTAERDFIHTKDVAKCIWKILNYDTPKDFVINTGAKTLIYALIENIKKQLEIPADMEVTEVDLSLWREDKQVHLDGQETRDLLDWTPEYDLDMIIKEIAEEIS